MTQSGLSAQWCSYKRSSLGLHLLFFSAKKKTEMSLRPVQTTSVSRQMQILLRILRFHFTSRIKPLIWFNLNCSLKLNTNWLIFWCIVSGLLAVNHTFVSHSVPWIMSSPWWRSLPVCLAGVQPDVEAIRPAGEQNPAGGPHLTAATNQTCQWKSYHNKWNHDLIFFFFNFFLAQTN